MYFSIYLFIYMGLEVEINICLVSFPSSLGSLQFLAVSLVLCLSASFPPHSNSLN